MRLSFFILILFLPVLASAQFGQGEQVMLINGKRTLEGYQNKLKFDLGLDARPTILDGERVTVGGLRIGAQYRRVHRFGVGFYFLNSRIFSRDFGFPIEEELVEYDFGYTALYYERVLYFDRKWEFTTGIWLGGGNVSVMYNLAGLNDRVKYTDLPFSAVEMSMYGEYYFLHWLGLGAGLGYRHVSDLGPEVRDSFSGPVLVVKVQANLFKLVRGIFDPKVKDEH